MHRLGWGLVIGGAALQVVGGVSSADAVLNGTPFEQTSIGRFTSPVETALHIPSGNLGWVLVASGLVILFVIPYVKAKL